MQPATAFARPYVISWNLTYRCNLACEHCYLDAGPTPLVGTDNFADRSELNTEECFKVIDEIAAFAPECLTILTGGEPLLRRDILQIVQRAAERGLWVVVGHQRRAHHRERGAQARRRPARVDSRCRSTRSIPTATISSGSVRGAWRNTVEGAEILNRAGLPFIVQTTAGSHNLGELDAIADFAHDRLGAKVWNLYFLVPTGRGQFVSDMTPAQYDGVLAALLRHPAPLPGADAGERQVRAPLHQDGAGTRGVRRGSDGGQTGVRRGSDRGQTGVRPRRDGDACLVRDQDLFRRRRRVPRRDPLHGHTSERRRDAVPVPPRVRGYAAQSEPHGSLDVIRSCSPASGSARRSADAAASAR